MDICSAVHGFEKTIDDIKKCVKAVVLERDIINNGVDAPSDIWVEELKVFRFVMNLSADDFVNIRFHTELINGAGLLAYWHPYPKIVPENDPVVQCFQKIVNEVPERYWVSEPPTPEIPRPLGVAYKGYILNGNVVRYQSCLSNLFFSGAFQYIDSCAAHQFVVEIGCGYGGLAHGMKKAVGNNGTCILVDLPEMFAFQGGFLALNNKDARIYVYDAESFTDVFIKQEMKNYDFVLLPNFVLDRLYDVDEIAVVVNMQSFQEMSDEQVDNYVQFAHKKAKYCLYSDNLDCHPYNEHLRLTVSEHVEKFFTIYPTRAFYKDFYDKLNMFDGRYQKHLAFQSGVVPPEDFYKKMIVRY
ncbi:MAG: putative sugar O-methyltransferase [Magnetococcales bacterium]|nr:putative sugar O-methyltransferase [Magnetococcales bacterium]